MDAESVDAIVTDPPAGISFMNKGWDEDKGGRDCWIAWMTTVAVECLRVIKPGGYALVWSLPRTSHWTATAWENAGWECRDKIVHIFGSGFPKSLNISKALDAAMGAEREVVGTTKGKGGENLNSLSRLTGNDNTDAKGCGAYGQGAKQITIDIPITAPTTDIAKLFEGYGTGLKPAHEDWILLRKPLEGTVAQNVLKHGCGGINVDGCKISASINDKNARPNTSKNTKDTASFGGGRHDGFNPSISGRFPANLIHDGSDEVLNIFPTTKSGKMMPTHIEDGYQKNTYGKRMEHVTMETYGDAGSAARFFYCAKSSPSDRGEGNTHPTVKSISLMRYLCRLITPPHGIIFDPFGGSGSTAIAAKMEGFQSILIEKEKEYVDIANSRIRGMK
jgi:site-specific DNA-methyltransferase (adenine-specific)